MKKVNTKMLLKTIEKRGLAPKTVRKALHITYIGWLIRLWKREFPSNEIMKLCNILQLAEYKDIEDMFFTEKGAEWAKS